MEKTVVCMKGESGSGKSSYVKKNFTSALVCSADDYFINQITGEYIWSADKIGAAHHQCKRNFMIAIKADYPLIVVDNTNTTNRELEYYVLEAKAAGYKVRIIRMEVPLKMLYGRNTHSVPDEVVKNMHGRMQTIPGIWGITEEIVKGY